MDKLKPCNDGKHNLINIFTSSISRDEFKVVRWCKDCGAIVIDVDVDGRTFAGNIMKMRLPKNTRPQIDAEAIFNIVNQYGDPYTNREAREIAKAILTLLNGGNNG